MKWVTSLLISCSLAVAGAVYAQQPDDQQTPAKGNKHAGNRSQQATSETSPGATNANPKHGRRDDAAGAKQQGQEPQRPVRRLNRDAQNGEKPAGEENVNGRKGKANAEERTANESNATESTTPAAKREAREGRSDMNARSSKSTDAIASPNATVSGATNARVTGGATPAANANPPANVNTTTKQRQTTNANVASDAVTGPNGKVKRVEEQKVQQIRQQHTSFHAQARSDHAPAVAFNANFRIQGADRWQGAQYEAFRAYHPERHDQGWYHQRYNRVELIGGGYYFWNNGYWYPAWGYDQGHEYYAYDGPIYVGQRAEPPDQVIADVQAELQEMGYYQGEVDGLLGPMTREALTAYQQDEGLMTTAAIDEPTLDSLGMSS
jgi:hypothetical protein